MSRKRLKQSFGSSRRAAPLGMKESSMIKRFHEEELLGKPLSEKQKKEIARAQNARDEDIDTSDIPETQEIPASAIRGKDFQPFPGAVDIKAIAPTRGCRKPSLRDDTASTCGHCRTGRAVGAQPPGPVRAYLTVIDRFPDIVAKALNGAA